MASPFQLQLTPAFSSPFLRNRTIFRKFVFAVLSLVTLASASALAAPAKKIIVYRGAGGCGSCAVAAAKAVRNLGLKIDYVGAADITPEIFENAVLWVQPAGNAITAANVIGPDRLAMIRNFVKLGGGYLGFCAGAFLADTTVDDEGKVTGIGLLPFSTADYEVNETDNIDMVWVEWNGKRRHLFFNGGTTFVLKEPSKDRPTVQVVATYSADRKPAVIRTTYGKGLVVLSGPHPEAPQTWKDKNEVDDLDGSDLDLANELARYSFQK